MPVPIVGRDRELAELAAAWAGRRSRVAVVTGPAGIGKSALVSCAVRALTPAPSTVLAGTARIHSPAPYDWLAAVLSGCDTSRLPSFPPAALAWLGQHDAAPVERWAPGALLRVAVRVVRALVGAGPAVLLVEDLHALDPASLNLVGELATAPELPVLLVVTSRPAASAQAPDLVARTLARLSSTSDAVRQRLGPLPRAAVADLLAAAFPGTAVSVATARAVYERTGGNPYEVTELLAAGHGPEMPLPDAATPVPELTSREAEVLACLGDGMSNKRIARSLGISVRTVTVHVSNLLRKTGTTSRTEAALWAVRRRPADMVPAPRTRTPAAPG
jgi:DNA-binding CsgD family transcriptional regulator